MSEATTIKLGGPGDMTLILRVTEGGRRRRRVYSVPMTVLEPYELKNVSAAAHRQLDQRFASPLLPKAEAAIVLAMHIMDGSS